MQQVNEYIYALMVAALRAGVVNTSAEYRA